MNTALHNIDRMAALLESMRDTQEYVLGPLPRVVYEAVRNDAKAIIESHDNYDCQKIVAVIDAVLTNPDGAVDCPSIEAVLRACVKDAKASLAKSVKAKREAANS